MASNRTWKALFCNVHREFCCSYWQRLCSKRDTPCNIINVFQLKLSVGSTHTHTHTHTHTPKGWHYTTRGVACWHSSRCCSASLTRSFTVATEAADRQCHAEWMNGKYGKYSCMLSHASKQAAAGVSQQADTCGVYCLGVLNACEGICGTDYVCKWCGKVPGGSVRVCMCVYNVCVCAHVCLSVSVCLCVCVCVCVKVRAMCVTQMHRYTDARTSIHRDAHIITPTSRKNTPSPTNTVPAWIRCVLCSALFCVALRQN